jgi:hypothetical protein
MTVTKTYRRCLSGFLLMQIATAFVPAGEDQRPNSSDASVLASVGGHPITVQEFRESYEYGPSFVKRSDDPKATHLQYLIDERLIALDGYAHGVDTVASVRRMLREIEDDAAVTEWYRRELAPLVHVDTSRVRKGVEEKSVTLSYRSIFTDDQDRIREIRILLDGGAPFDSLYAALKGDPGVSLNGATEDFFAAHERNPRVASALALMKPGTCSGIISADSGYYLLRLDYAKKDIIVSATAYRAMWSRVDRYVAREILDSITVAHIRGVMEASPPTISGDALKALFRFMSGSVLPSQAGTKHEGSLRDFAQSEVILASIPDNETLVNSTCDRFTIQDFAAWYAYRGFKVDFSRVTASSVRTVKDLIFTMVRDRRLITIARSKGYGDAPEVKAETDRWKAKLSYWKQKFSAIPQRVSTGGEVQKFYEENRHQYERDAKGSTVTYEQAKAKVQNDLTVFEYNKQLFRYLNVLRQRYQVRIDEPLLKSLHVSDEGLSKKIDLVILKKGGTLQRRAFPSIDVEWQFFQ